MITDHDISGCMIAYGGSFVAALGQAYRLADAQNKNRIRVAFSDYWQQYRERAMQEALRLTASKQSTL